MIENIYSKFVQSILRKLLTGLGSILVAKGYVEDALFTEVVAGAALILVSSVWSFWAIHRDALYKRALVILGIDAPWGTPTGIVVANAKAQVSAGTVPPASALLLALSLVGSTVPVAACGQQTVTTSPHIVTASYAADILLTVADAQQVITEYARAGGGRTATTDQVMTGIRMQVIPAAQQLRGLLVSYDQIASLDLRAAQAGDIETALEVVEDAVELVLRERLPAGLPAQLGATVSRVQQLVAAIRVEILKGVLRG